MTKIIKEHFHRMQLAKAKNFIRLNIGEKLSIDELAKQSGASPYHFIRVFSAYTGETPFTYIRRQRIYRSLELLQTEQSITHIALEIGFETSSSFNKAFKKETNLTPSEFRNLGKEKKEKLVNDIYIGPKAKEIIMNIKMDMTPQIISRNETAIYSFGSRDSSFKEAAQFAWQEFLVLIGKSELDFSESEFLGVGDVENDLCTYRAAVSAPKGVDLEVPGLTKETIPASKYARFLLKGSYEGVWYAFDMAFKNINESQYELGDGPTLENYLNDPSSTPEDELLTEILIPIK